METVMKILNGEIFRKNTPKPTENDLILEDIRNVSRMINEAYERFEFESDSDLVEATVYELEALKARYRYLLRLAKAKGIKGDDNNTISFIREKGVDDLG